MPPLIIMEVATHSLKTPELLYKQEQKMYLIICKYILYELNPLIWPYKQNRPTKLCIVVHNVNFIYIVRFFFLIS